MKFFFALFVLATAAWGEAPKAIPRGNSKADLAELKAGLTERKVRLEKVLAKFLEEAKRQNIGQNGINVVELRQALEKRIKARTALRASSARQDINLDPLEAYLSQLDNRMSALENSTDDGVGNKMEADVKKLTKQQNYIWTMVNGLDTDLIKLEKKFAKMESTMGQKKDKCEVRMQSSDLIKATYSGTPGASSEWSTTHTADNAFKPQVGKPWASKSLPATVWYKFNYYFKLAKISFSSRNDGSWDQTPKTFEAVGSYDCSNWHVLKSVSNANFTKGGQTKAWDIPCEKQKSYRCYGIKASANSGHGSQLVSLANTQMYHLPEY